MKPIELTLLSLIVMLGIVVLIGGVAGYVGHTTRNNGRQRRRVYIDPNGTKVIVAGFWADVGIGCFFAGASWILYSVPALIINSEVSLGVLIPSVLGAGLVGLAGRSSKVEMPDKPKE